MVNARAGLSSYTFAWKKIDLDLTNRASPPAKSSMEEPPVLELKALPSHLWYASLGDKNILMVIIVVDLVEWQVEALVLIL